MNLETINKWLENEYGVSYTRLEELHDFVIDQDLKHQEEKDKQIQELTNNWNELEEYIKERIQYWEEQEKEWIKRGFMQFGGEANTKIILQGLLGKMEEIKENNK